MLFITRRQGEKLLIGEETTIEIVEIAGNSVRLAIEAPRSVAIYREELWLAVKRENEVAAAAAPDALPSSGELGK